MDEQRFALLSYGVFENGRSATINEQRFALLAN